MLLDYALLAFNSLIHKKVRSWLTLLGIFIGVAAVVSLIGLGDGLRTAITSQFGVSSTEVLAVQAGGLSGAGPPGTGVINPLTEEDNDAIEKLSNVEYAIPRIIQTGKLEFNNRLNFGFAMSIPEGNKRDLVYQVLDLKPAEGRMLKDGDVGKVVLGWNFLSNDAGYGKAIHAGDTVTIQDKKFKVIGITKKKGSFIFDNIVHMNVNELKDLFGIKDRVDAIAVKVKSPDLIPKAKEDIEKLLRKRRNVKVGEEDFEVQTPDQALAQLDSILVGVQIFIIMIASISIVIGAIGIINTMFTSVVERRKQIGIMKSLGAKNIDIFYQFFFEAGMMGFIGGLIGTIIGTGIAFLGTFGINSFVGSSSSPSINFVLIFSALFGSFVIGAVAGIIPALRAAHQNPVDALRS